MRGSFRLSGSVSGNDVLGCSLSFGRIDQGDAAAAESTAAKAGPVDAVRFDQDVVEIDQGFGAALIIFDGAEPGLGNEPSEFFEVSPPPRL